MKVLMVIPSYYPVMGGAEEQLRGLSRELVMGDAPVYSTIVTRRLPGTHSNECVDKVDVVRLFAKVYPAGFLFSLLFFLFRNIRKFNVVHVHTLNSPALICVIVGVLTNTPVVLKVTRSGKNTQLSRLLMSPLRSLMASLMFRGASKIVAITRDVERELIESGVIVDKIISIPNGVKIFDTTQYNDQLKKTTFVYVGRLIDRKRVGLLISSWKEADLSSDYELQIVGDGPLREELTNQIDCLGLSDSVKLRGKMAHNGVIEILKNSDVFVLPSDSEGMSNALLEAMACFNAVIASDIAANRELIVNEQTGVLFSNAECLSDRLSELGGDFEKIRWLAQNASDLVGEKYSFRKVSNDYKALYHGISRR